MYNFISMFPNGDQKNPHKVKYNGITYTCGDMWSP